MIMQTRQQGFTLIELLIVIVVMAILATIAYPSFQTFIRKARLENVRSELVENARNMERYYAQKSTFADYPKDALVQNDYFTLSFEENPNDSGFILQAVPNAEYKSTEPCTVYLNDSGIFWAQASDSSGTCPGYEEPHVQ